MHAGSLARALTLAAICALLGGCGGASGVELTAADLAYSHPARATTPAAPLEDPTLYPDDDDDSGPSVQGSRLQCVPYAREHSSINLHGDAYTWWDKAAGVYARASTPSVGSVLVLNGYARRRAHVAVVRRIVSPREIRIDHANWNDDGAIYVNDPVVDISPDNDWSVVKVWNIRTGSWGVKTYNVQGFIGPAPADANPAVAFNAAPRPSDPIALAIAASDTDSDDSDDDR